MRWLRFAVLICLAAIIQASFLSNFRSKPELLVILLVFFAVYGSISGFAADLIGPTMGSLMITYGVLGTSLAYLNRVIAIRKIPYQALAIFAITILAGIMANILNSFKSVSTIEYSVILKNAIYSGIAGPLVFMPAAWWMRIRMGRNRRRF